MVQVRFVSFNIYIYIFVMPFITKVGGGVSVADG